jgi:hypothetical protein
MKNALTTCAAALALALVPSFAFAQTTNRDTPAEPAGDLGNHQRHVRVDIGVRTQFVRSEGFDPFARKDVLPQLTLGASYYFWSRGRLSLGGALAFDYGAPSDDVRSSKASLDVLRFTLAPELRYHVLRVLALTAKVGPTLTREKATYSAPEAELSKTAWRAGLDATAGVAFEVFGYASGASKKPRMWVTAEGGYGWTASNRLRLSAPESGSVPQRLTPVDFGELSLSGPLFRVTAALSFW